MDFYINLNLNEEFEEQVKIPNKSDFSYNSFSEGQKMRIDIAILLTWREISRLKNSVNTNILVLDEVYDSSLDSTGLEDFKKLLKNITEDGTNIFIISHKEEILGDDFDRTIKVELRNGFTQIKQKFN
jgi:energy-coupling factor transporter ATP-binding protein EcfA2